MSLPISWFDRDLLINQFPAHFKDEMASFCLAAFCGAEGADEYPLGVREKRVRQFLL